MGSFLEEFGAKELWQAHDRIWNHALSYIRSMCLKCARELGIEDIIHSHGKPITLSQVETALRIPPARSACFRQLIRLLVHLEYFSQISDVGGRRGWGWGWGGAGAVVGDDGHGDRRGLSTA
ncbi:hypothetical protein C4D60_Mb05t16180 [Musa balbisiana]|uniref:O-methyltransferase dimerisation domain-containing protein n=1 Tax=Musa balbisiana TaxID=52838 RepID=A0A4S8JWK0_MUSBA|nr:hypothetical protein C4D60_Mb05t16180 [Musa balbisiana]